MYGRTKMAVGDNDQRKKRRQLDEEPETSSQNVANEEATAAADAEGEGEALTPSPFTTLQPAPLPTFDPTPLPTRRPTRAPNPRPTKAKFVGIPIAPPTTPAGGITLKAIGFTCAGGFIVSFISLLCFGWAVKRRNVNVAPRCTARNGNTLYNPAAGRGSGGSGDDGGDGDIDGSGGTNGNMTSAARRVKRRARTDGKWFSVGSLPSSLFIGRHLGRLFPRTSSPASETDPKEERARQARVEARAGAPGTSMYIDGSNGAAGGGASLGLAQRLKKAKSAEERVGTAAATAKKKGGGGGKELDEGRNDNAPPTANGSHGTASSSSGDGRGDGNGSRRRPSDGGSSVHTDSSSIPSKLKYGRGSDRYAPDPEAAIVANGSKGGSSGGGASGVSFNTDNSLLIGNDPDAGDVFDDASNDDVSVQWRGNPWTGWIPWTLALSYDTMLRGVPGTGTRRKGLEGSLLRVNLDAIVLFRFHAICLRVAVLATILCIGVVLPLNLTARCHNTSDDPTDPDYDPLCFAANYTLTDYERTTLKNIPPLTYADADDPVKNLSDDAGFVERLIAAFKNSAANTIWGSAYRRNLGRLYGIVLCSWIITWYAIRIIGREWIDALALRRVYYLENDHWEDRKDELSETLLRDDEDSDSDSDDEGGSGCCSSSKNASAVAKAQRTRRRANRPGTAGGGAKTGTRRHHRRRDPWIPHPEQRDTVPNVELYSVLVGGLPSLPSEVVDEQDIEAAVGYSRRQSIDWQLAVATSFFDHCVPNQPGFSSSIAAITILPDAPELARAWRKWYVAAAALRRLRFIRILIADLRHYDFDDFDDADSEHSFENENPTVRESIEMKLADPNRKAALSGAFHSHRLSHGAGGASMGAMNNIDTVGVDISYQAAFAESTDGIDGIGPAGGDDTEAKAIYLDMQRRMKYYRNVFGSSDNEDVEALLFQALNYGPEQSAVYSREMAQGAAACCPNGCGEERLRRAGIDELLVLERDAVAAVHDANLDLQFAQARAAVSVLDTGDPKMHLPQKGHREDMERHLEEDRNFVPLRSKFSNVKDDSSGSANTPSKEHNRSDFSEPSGGKTHHKSSSFDDLSLPEALQMEGQLLAKFTSRRQDALSRNARPGPISRHVSAPVSSIMAEASMLTPTTSNHKRTVTPVGQAKDESIELGLKELRPLHLPTIGETSGSKNSTLSQSVYPLASRTQSQQSHPSTVYVSGDPDHPFLQNGESAIRSSTAGSAPATRLGGSVPSTASSMSTTQTHASNGGRNSVYGRIPHGPSGLATGTNKAMALSSGGKFYLRDATSPRGIPGADGGASVDYNSNYSARRSLSPTSNVNRPGNSSTGNLLDLPPASASSGTGLGDWPPSSNVGVASTSGLSRRRLNTDTSLRSSASRRGRTNSGNQEPSVQWAAVERIFSDDATARGQDSSRHNGERYAVRGKHKPTTGVWKMPTLSSMARNLGDIIIGVFKAAWSYATHKTNAVVDDLARESTFAVVTFTSRQAAVAARHCIADGRGHSRWLTVEEIPVPPLSDAAPCDFITCRGCCRPVSLSIPKKQQMLRKYFSFLLLALIYVFYTFPISAAAAFADPTKLYELWPELEEIVNNSVFFRQILAGIVPALLFTLFFALCPVMFKAIANFGSNATSVAFAEKSALNYYWWFMVCTAFSGSSLMTTVLNAFNEGQVANTVTQVLVEIAGTIPTQVASTWINWIIVRTTMTLPLQYMLQVNTFLFKCIGWKCCARCVVGGGPGGPIPYRIYIDSGVVFLCIVSLAPASPLVAPFALLYFLYCAPLWRRNCLFVYRPKFDSGGSRWPFLSEVFLWSMFVGQILLTTMMALKEAVGPAILAALPIIPTLLFRKMSRHRFLKSYMDAGLLQTSLLDGWDHGVPTAMEKREEFRQFLVDGHKAAYIPICIAGGATNVLTAEPALVMPHENDGTNMDLPPVDIGADHQTLYTDDGSLGLAASTPELQARASSQYGASLRRLPVGIKNR